MAMALEPATIVYALRCAANWLEERGDPSYVDLPDERGQILRWNRDNSDDDHGFHPDDCLNPADAGSTTPDYPRTDGITWTCTEG